jgi:cytochrome c-type biogenesis protein CcmH/NrfG
MNLRTPQPQPNMNKNEANRNDNDSAVLWTIVAFVLLAVVVYIVYAAYDNNQQYSVPAERATITNQNTPANNTNNSAATTPAPGNTTTQ